MGIYKKYYLKFSLFNAVFVCLFVLLFLFIIYKMIDSMDIFKSLNINIGTVMKNQEVLNFVSDHLKTKKMGKHAVKKLPYLLRYVRDWYKAQQMCDKATLENGGTLKFVPDC